MHSQGETIDDRLLSSAYVFGKRKRWALRVPRVRVLHKLTSRRFDQEQKAGKQFYPSGICDASLEICWLAEFEHVEGDVRESPNSTVVSRSAGRSQRALRSLLGRPAPSTMKFFASLQWLLHFYRFAADSTIETLLRPAASHQRSLDCSDFG